MWNFLRRKGRVEPDTAEPMKIVKDAKEAEERNRARGAAIEVVAARLEYRIEKNHFSESLAAAWARKGEAH